MKTNTHSNAAHDPNSSDVSARPHAPPTVGQSAPEMISIKLLDPHPDNPRFALREDVIEQIRAGLVAEGFHPANALTVVSTTATASRQNTRARNVS